MACTRATLRSLRWRRNSTQKLTLIEQGQLRSFLHSEATARAFGVQPTGHAGLGAKVSVGPDWFVVQTSEGASSGTELDHSSCNDPFVLIEDLSALHAGVKATQGSFSLPFDGWLVKGGERISVEAATVAGDIRSLLKSIVHLEQLEVTHRGVSPCLGGGLLDHRRSLTLRLSSTGERRPMPSPRFPSCTEPVTPWSASSANLTGVGDVVSSWSPPL